MSKTNQQVAIEVIAGKWSSGLDRRNKLAAAGYDPDAVQSIVNALMSGQEPQPEAPTAPPGKFRKITLDLSKYDGLEVYLK